MATRIESGGPPTGVVAVETAPRVTPPPVRPFRALMNGGASAVLGGADAAIRRLPGGPILATAVRGGVAGPPSLQPTSRAEGPTGTAGSDATAPGGGSPSSVEDSLTRYADQNLYYLELQQRISAESQAYSAISNVLKTRHETVKNAIGNIR